MSIYQSVIKPAFQTEHCSYVRLPKESSAFFFWTKAWNTFLELFSRRSRWHLEQCRIISNMLPYFKWMPSRFLIHHNCIWLQILSEATKLNIQGVVGQLAPLAESTSGSNLIGCMLTFVKKCCKPTECLLLVTAHQPQQKVLRLFKGIHLFSAAENPTKPLPCSNGCQIHVADIWTDVAFSILKVIQCI